MQQLHLVRVAMCRPLVLAAFVLAALAPRALAQPADSVAVTEKLFAVTVTVRLSLPKVEPGPKAAQPEKAPPRTDSAVPQNEAPPPGQATQPGTQGAGTEAGVIVLSGVSLGQGWIVTSATAPANARCRVTLPDGEQAEARLRVLDLYSGLSLYQIPADKLAGLEIRDEPPPAGATIYTAAASGIERPIVSRGIVGGADRTLTGTGLPPLLQCDVRTTDTSTGAAVVDDQGRLVGVVSVTAVPGQGDGWTYAVPVRHVQRLLRAKTDEAEGKVVVLKQQRPSIGLTMIPGKQADTVAVERVMAGGPAASGGVAQGDEVLEVDGVKVRSVYQIVALILKKQPGDRMDFLLRRGDQTLTRQVVLGGGAIVEPSELVQSDGQLVIRRVVVGRAGENAYSIERGARVVPLAATQTAPTPQAGAGGQAQRLPRDELSLLQEQVNRFATFIQKLQADLKRRDDELARTQKLVEELQKEIEKLRMQDRK
jgi:serine protease Do